MQVPALSGRCQQSPAATGTSDKTGRWQSPVNNGTILSAFARGFQRLPEVAAIIVSIDRNFQKLPEIAGIFWKKLVVAAE